MTCLEKTKSPGNHLPWKRGTRQGALLGEAGTGKSYSADKLYQEDLRQQDLQPNTDGVLECRGRIRGHYPISLPTLHRYISGTGSSDSVAWGALEETPAMGVSGFELFQETKTKENVLSSYCCRLCGTPRMWSNVCCVNGLMSYFETPKLFCWKHFNTRRGRLKRM